MNALVTGGAGFIGSNLTKELLKLGHQVVVLDNLLSGYKKNLDGLDCFFVEGDYYLRSEYRKCGESFYIHENKGEYSNVYHQTKIINKKK